MRNLSFPYIIRIDRGSNRALELRARLNVSGTLSRACIRGMNLTSPSQRRPQWYVVRIHVMHSTKADSCRSRGFIEYTSAWLRRFWDGIPFHARWVSALQGAQCVEVEPDACVGLIEESTFQKMQSSSLFSPQGLMTSLACASEG